MSNQLLLERIFLNDRELLGHRKITVSAFQQHYVLNWKKQKTHML